MQDPQGLFRYTADVPTDDRGASVLLVALEGFLDAGRPQKLVTNPLLATHDSKVVARFNIDEMFDYRGRRPVMTFSGDRWTDFDAPELSLHRLLDKEGHPFLLLEGPEPDYQWERFTAAVVHLVDTLGVELTVSAHGIPMAVPHTRPIGVTKHATNESLIGENESVFGTVNVPGSVSGLLEMRLGEAGRDAVGFAVHVPHYLAQLEYGDAAVVALESFAGATGLELETSALTATANLNRAELAREIEANDEVGPIVAALEQQYDAFVEARQRPSLLATEGGELPTADEIGAEFEAFLRTVTDEQP